MPKTLPPYDISKLIRRVPLWPCQVKQTNKHGIRNDKRNMVDDLFSFFSGFIMSCIYFDSIFP